MKAKYDMRLLQHYKQTKLATEFEIGSSVYPRRYVVYARKIAGEISQKLQAFRVSPSGGILDKRDKPPDGD